MCQHSQDYETCRFGCTLRKKEELRLENDQLKERIKALENYLRRRFIATCPDAYCKKDCQNSPEVDKWIEQALKG